MSTTAPIIFADAIDTVNLVSGTVRFTFVTNEPGVAPPENGAKLPTRPSAQIVMPLSALAQISQLIANVIGALEQQGVLKRADAPIELPGGNGTALPEMAATPVVPSHEHKAGDTNAPSKAKRGLFS